MSEGVRSPGSRSRIPVLRISTISIHLLWMSRKVRTGSSSCVAMPLKACNTRSQSILLWWWRNSSLLLLVAVALTLFDEIEALEGEAIVMRADLDDDDGICCVFDRTDASCEGACCRDEGFECVV